jgi:hypothetical protein
MRIDMTFSCGLLFLVAVTRPCASATRLFCARPRVFSVKCVTPNRNQNNSPAPLTFAAGLPNIAAQAATARFFQNLAGGK